MSRWIKVTGAVALSMGLAAAAFAAGGVGGHHGRRHHGPGRMMEDVRLLDLSDEQQAAVKDLFRQQHETARPLREREWDLRRQLREAASAPGADPAKVGQMAIEAQRVGEQLRDRHKQMEASLVGLLTPEQKEMWAKIRASREKERGRHKGGRGFGHGPRAPEGEPEDDVRQ